ncbi:hypothetical protein FACS1894170_12170 [Planctomycetales bacterium]|nr:hypothetical protein FACS1894170_12170 [Planctomycetales bacterium]
MVGIHAEESSRYTVNRIMKKYFAVTIVAVFSAIIANAAFCQGPPQQIDPPTSFIGVLFAPRTTPPRYQAMVGAVPTPCEQDVYAAPAQGQNTTVVEQQRIVYVPYACPPPIFIEHQRSLRQPHQRSALAKLLPFQQPDAYIQEYPEMPQRMYTTRGPRDFLAPNPPSIGE